MGSYSFVVDPFQFVGSVCYYHAQYGASVLRGDVYGIGYV